MEQMVKENWRPINGFEGYYEVSDLGRVRSLDRTVKTRNGLRKYKGKIRSLALSENGYYVVFLNRPKLQKGFLLHRLIASAFIKNENSYKCVNHINGIKTDNRIENLEWCSHSHNNKHAYDIGLKKVVNPNRGEKNGNSKLTKREVVKIKRLISSGESDTEISRKTPVTSVTISRIRKGLCWKHIKLAENLNIEIPQPNEQATIF